MNSEQINQIEDAWLARAAAQGLVKNSAKYKRAEVEFFVGAMTAINAFFPEDDKTRLSSKVPVYWVINGLSGRPIVERK